MRLQLHKEDKGYSIRDADERWIEVATLSAVDAAELLFELKDELRRTELGRYAIDIVAKKRKADA